MIIEVTKEDIEKDCRGNPWECPVNTAVYRKTGIPCRTGKYTITFAFSEYVVNLPPDVTKKIQKFDDGMNLEPFKFDLDISPKLIKKIKQNHPLIRNRKPQKVKNDKD